MRRGIAFSKDETARLAINGRANSSKASAYRATSVKVIP